MATDPTMVVTIQVEGTAPKTVKQIAEYIIKEFPRMSIIYKGEGKLQEEVERMLTDTVDAEVERQVRLYL